MKVQITPYNTSKNLKMQKFEIDFTGDQNDFALFCEFMKLFSKLPYSDGLFFLQIYLDKWNLLSQIYNNFL